MTSAHKDTKLIQINISSMSPVDLAQLGSNLLPCQGWIAAHHKLRQPCSGRLVNLPHDCHCLSELVDTHQTVFLVVKGVESLLQLEQCSTREWLGTVSIWVVNWDIRAVPNPPTELTADTRRSSMRSKLLVCWLFYELG